MAGDRLFKIVQSGFLVPVHNDSRINITDRQLFVIKKWRSLCNDGVLITNLQLIRSSLNAFISYLLLMCIEKTSKLKDNYG